MVAISFIVTTYNVAPYVDHCLRNIVAVAEPGDEVILIDDCSTDGTVEKIEAFTAGNNFADGVDFRPFLLGTNTIGGVGIPANVGLDEARNDTIFFVDGDDWIDPAGFRKARAYWDANSNDILFTNYMEFDDKTKTSNVPSDTDLWNQFNTLDPTNVSTEVALAFIAVPWRKFYRRSLIETNKLRFPEGDFFFEDNPFHWAVCLAAKQIGFFDRVLCYHRVNREGQTMISTGVELIAFFTHFETILDLLPDDKPALKAAAARWLLSNMAWNVQRLERSSFETYFSAAATTLKKIDDETWNGEVAATEHVRDIWPIASRLRSGDVWGTIDSFWLRDLQEQIGSLKESLDRIEKIVDSTHRTQKSLSIAARFHELKENLGYKP